MTYYKIEIPQIQYYKYAKMTIFFAKKNERTRDINLDLPFNPEWLDSQIFFLSEDIYSSILNIKLFTLDNTEEIYEREIISLAFSFAVQQFNLQIVIRQAAEIPFNKLRIYCNLNDAYEIITDLSIYKPKHEKYEVYYKNETKMEILYNEQVVIFEFEQQLACFVSIGDREFCVIARPTVSVKSKTGLFSLQLSGAMFYVFSNERLNSTVFLRGEQRQIKENISNLSLISESQKVFYFQKYPRKLIVYTFPTFSILEVTELINNEESGSWELEEYKIRLDFIVKKNIDFVQSVRKRAYPCVNKEIECYLDDFQTEGIKDVAQHVRQRSKSEKAEHILPEGNNEVSGQLIVSSNTAVLKPIQLKAKSSELEIAKERKNYVPIGYELSNNSSFEYHTSTNYSVLSEINNDLEDINTEAKKMNKNIKSLRKII